MTNTQLLTKKISDKGIKVGFIAEQMGISRQTLSKKINNRVPFDQYEITKICDILGITSLREKDSIFFAS